MDKLIPTDRAAWKHIYMGALYALGCDPADLVLDMMVRETESPSEVREAIAHMHALPESKRAFPGYVHTGLDYLRSRRVGKRISVRLDELRKDDLLVYNEGTPRSFRMRVIGIEPRGDGSAYVNVVDVDRSGGYTGRGRTVYGPDEILLVERSPGGDGKGVTPAATEASP